MPSRSWTTIWMGCESAWPVPDPGLPLPTSPYPTPQPHLPFESSASPRLYLNEPLLAQV